MNALEPIAFDGPASRAQLDAFRALLADKAELSERDDLLPLFRASPQLVAFVDTLFPNHFPANRYAREFRILGSFAADFLIGNFERKTFCAIELEDARPNSIFQQIAGRARPPWGSRLERGFSQLVDWFYAFDDQRQTAEFARHFGYGQIEFYAVLLIGRSANLADPDRERLRWRSSRVAINTHKVYCWTYDELAETLDTNLRSLLASAGPQSIS